MNLSYAHILYNENEFISPKKAIFDHRAKTGFITTWSPEHATILLEKKHWSCLSAYALESSIRRKVIFERKHSDTNLLYFKYELEIADSIESYFDFEVVRDISDWLSLREVTEEIFKMLKSYQEGKTKFDDRTFSSWLAIKLNNTSIDNDAKDILERSIMKYVETFISKIVWNTYSGNLHSLGKDLSSIVYLYTEMFAFALDV